MTFISLISIIAAAAAPDAGAAGILQFVLPGLFGGGLILALVAVAKFRPEATSAAVIQANTAMEGMGKLIDELKEDRKALQEELEKTRATVAELTGKVTHLTNQINELRSEGERWRTIAEEHGSQDPQEDTKPEDITS
jgi:septal ring factor EnvC (AmiA/AmiB activator)